MLGRKQCDLPFQIRQAVGHFIWLGIPVVGRSALEHIGNEHLLASETNAAQHRIEQTAGTTHEGFALLVFVGTGCLANHQPLRLSVTYAKHRAVPALVQLALDAARNFGCHGVPGIRTSRCRYRLRDR